MTTREIFQNEPYARNCAAVVGSINTELSAFSVDQTVFYPLGGGQLGDQGLATAHSGERFEIIDTRRGRDSGQILHFCSPDSPLPNIGTNVTMELDWERRYRLMRMHSCMHLLCALIPAQVTGGQIYPDRGRLDFDLDQTVDKVQLQQSLNRVIFNGSKRDVKWITEEQLDRNPKLVRTMSVEPPRGNGSVRLVHFQGVDLQPCGGTHVAISSEIGPVRVEKVEKKGRKIRRITIVFDE